MWQYRKVYERYRVPNYKKFLNYNRNERNEQIVDYNTQGNDNGNRNSTRTNYSKEQGKGNFDKESNTIYGLFKQIKDEMKQVREELNRVNERINRLEKDTTSNPTVTEYNQTTSNNKGKDLDFQIKNPSNNRGIQNSYERARKDMPRCFEQQSNANGKRLPLGSEGNTSNSTQNNNANLNKQRRLSDESKDSNSKTNEEKEIQQLKEMLDNSNAKSKMVEDKLDKALKLLEMQCNQQTNYNVNNV